MTLDDSPAAIDDATANLLFRDARTIKRFSPDEVSDEEIAAAYDLMRWGPTALNTSPLRYLVVRSPEARARLITHLGEGNHEGVLAAPVTLVVAADTAFHERLDRLAPHAAAIAAGLDGQPTVREGMARMNASIQAGYLITALRASGLQVGPMGIQDATGLEADLFEDESWRALFIINVGQAPAVEGATYPRAARLDAAEVSRTV
ncbi:malonic semialdehyde reductase [Sanguibacter sp. A247]|uniref:malonic semialdehyde reductase n=1 Tax=unclassified Sanguibacter TaxID=2645534 RepID=UPI003FD73B8E